MPRIVTCRHRNNELSLFVQFVEQKLGFCSTGTFSWRDVLSPLLRAVVVVSRVSLKGK